MSKSRYLPLQYCIEAEKFPDSLSSLSFERIFPWITDRDFGILVQLKHIENLDDSKLKIYSWPSICLIELWKTTKQVYELDPDFSRVLLSTDSIKVYPELLKRIPFKDFYIDLSNNDFFQVDGIFVSIRVYDDDEIRILYMVTDKKEHKKEVDIIDFTHRKNIKQNLEDLLSADSEALVEFTQEEKDEFLNDLSELSAEEKESFLKALENYTDKRVCTEKDYVPMPYNASYYVLDKSKCPEVYEGYNSVNSKEDKSSPKEPISKITLFVIQFLLYLSSERPNITQSELTKQTYRPTKNPQNRFSEIQIWDVELYYGKTQRIIGEKHKRNPAINSSENLEEEDNFHKRPRPHTRGAHWHSYWCGSGKNKHIELRWIDVIYVNGTHKDIITKISEVEL